MKKQKDQNKTTGKKEGRPVSQVVPSFPQAKPPRESVPTKNPEHFEKEFICEYEPNALFDEWPGDEEAKNHDFNDFEPNQQFTDTTDMFLPKTTITEANNEIKWLRPDSYIREKRLDQELRNRMIGKDITTLRLKIRSLYDTKYRKKGKSGGNTGLGPKMVGWSGTSIGTSKKEKSILQDIGELLKNQEESVPLNSQQTTLMKSGIQIKEVNEDMVQDEEFQYENRSLRAIKEFFPYYSDPIDITVVNSKERQETQEEYLIRKENEEIEKINKDPKQKGKEAKKTTKDQSNKTTPKISLNIINEENPDFLTIYECNPRDISQNSNHPRYFKWIASQLQSIKDSNLVDCYTGQSICQKIYPQDASGIPIYNPNGKYWVKLFHMGKYRKVEVDDCMPCNKYDNLIFPSSENVLEIWPAIITKALLKIFSYKYKQNDFFFEEIGDCSVINALTAYVGEKIEFMNFKQENFDMIQHLIRDNSYKNKQKFILCYKSANLYKKFEEIVSLEAQLVKKQEEEFLIPEPDIKLSTLNANYVNKTSLKHLTSKMNISNVKSGSLLDLDNVQVEKEHKIRQSIQLSSEQINANSVMMYKRKPSFISNTILPIINKGGKKLKPSKTVKIGGLSQALENTLSKVENSDRSFSPDKLEKTDRTNNTELSGHKNTVDIGEMSNRSGNSVKKPSFQEEPNKTKKNFARTETLHIQQNNQILNTLPFMRRNTRNFTTMSPPDRVKEIRKLVKNVGTSKTFDRLTYSATKKINNWVLMNLGKSLKSGLSKDYPPNFAVGQVLTDTLRKGIEILGEDKLTDNINQKIDFDYAYTISESFTNNNFNMKRLKPIDFSDLKNDKTKDWKILSKEEKKKIRDNKKDTLRKQREESIDRVMEYKLPGKKICYLKINDQDHCRKFNFYIPFSDHEMHLAQRCVLNNWDFPPLSYFDFTFKKPKISSLQMSSFGQTPMKRKIKSPSELKSPQGGNTARSGKKSVGFAKEVTQLNPKGSIDQTGLNNENDSDRGDDKLSYKLKKGLSTEEPPVTAIQTLNSIAHINWTKEVYNFLIENNTEQFIEELEVLEREPGSWVTFNEFTDTFNTILVFHNPKYYTHCLKCDNNWYDYENEIYESNQDFKVVHLSKSSEMMPYNNNKSVSNQSCFLLVLEFNNTLHDHWEDIANYVMFDIVDSNGKVLKKDILLNNSFSTYQFEELERDEEYYIVFQSEHAPFGYHYTVHSNHMVESISYNNYLNKCHNYSINNFKIEHPIIKSDNLYFFEKIVLRANSTENNNVLETNISTNANLNTNPTNTNFNNFNATPESNYRKQSDDDDSVTQITFEENPKSDRKFKVDMKYSDKYALQFLEIFLTQGPHGENCTRVHPNQFLNLKETNDPFYIVMFFCPPYALKENSINLDILTNISDINLEKIDNIAPYEFYDKYTNNKHGIIFKENIYAADLVHASFHIRLCKESDPKPSTDQSSVLDKTGGKDLTPTKKKEAKDKGAKDKSSLLINSMIDKSYLNIVDNIKVALELYDRDNKLIFKKDGLNQFIVKNLDFEGMLAPVEDKKGKKDGKDGKEGEKEHIQQPYKLVFKLDEGEIPNYLKNPEQSRDVYWNIKCFSSDTLGFVKDTSKEDNENTIKSNWETNDPGRSLKAAIARKKVLLLMRKKKGELLSPEEEQILCEKREIKLSEPVYTIPEVEKHSAPKGTKPDSKKDKKIKEVQPEEKKFYTTIFGYYSKENGMQGPVMPSSTKHASKYVKDFVGYCNQNHKIMKNSSNNLTNYAKSCRTFDLRKQKQQEIESSIDVSQRCHTQYLEEVDQTKTLQTETLQKAFLESKGFHSSIHLGRNPLLEKRAQIKSAMYRTHEQEKKLREIICSVGLDINYQVELYQSVCSNREGIENDLLEKAHDCISKRKDEMYKIDMKKYTVKDKPNIIKILEDIKLNSWVISKEVMDCFKELTNSDDHHGKDEKHKKK